MINNNNNVSPISKANHQYKINKTIKFIDEIRLDLEKLKSCKQYQEFPQYLVEIIENEIMKDNEQTLKFDNLNQHQKNISNQNREIAVDWMIDVCHVYYLELHVLELSVILFDEYISEQKFKINLEEIQLIAAACIVINSKFINGRQHFDIEDAVYMSDNAYTIAEIVDTEEEILKKLDYKLNKSTISYFFQHFEHLIESSNHKNVESISKDIKKYFEYILIIVLLDSSFLKIKRVTIASSIMYVLIRFFNLNPIDFGIFIELKNNHSGLITCVTDIFHHIKKPEPFTLTFFAKKYKNFGKIFEFFELE